MITDRKRISFEFVSDASKQVTTVAAALVGLSITFRQDLMKGVTDVPKILQATVALYVLTVIMGVYVLLALTGALGREKAAHPRAAAMLNPGAAQLRDRGIADEDLTIYRGSIRAPFFFQLLFFLLAVVGTFMFGWTRYGVPTKPATPPTYAFARAQLRSGMRCVLTARSDAEGAECARRSSELAFRYGPPPADAAAIIAALDAATRAASSAKLPKKPRPGLSDNRLRIVDAYVALDSLLSTASADSAAAAAAAK
ncbi:MAG: hypothetical protein JJD97_10075 [Gemmatimonadaceae bacterium]|nr:hypothetical protein [Gemmatimonadaceae bacterium]